MTARGFGVVDALSRKTSGCPSSVRASSGNSGRTRCASASMASRSSRRSQLDPVASLERRAPRSSGKCRLRRRGTCRSARPAIAVAVARVDLEPLEERRQRARAPPRRRATVARRLRRRRRSRRGRASRWFTWKTRDRRTAPSARSIAPRGDERAVGAHDRVVRPALRRSRAAARSCSVRRPAPVDLHEVADDEAHERLRHAVERRHDDERHVLRPGRRHLAREELDVRRERAWCSRPSSPSMKSTPTSLAP